jgi:hypothetical protein
MALSSRIRRALSGDIRALVEGIRNDNKNKEKYAAHVGDSYDVDCPNCDSNERDVTDIYGPTMGVRCFRCKHYEIVERPRATKGMAL